MQTEPEERSYPHISKRFQLIQHSIRQVLPKAILFGLGTFAVAGIVIIAAQYGYRLYLSRRNPQLIQQSDNLFSFEFSSTLPPSKTSAHLIHWKDSALAAQAPSPEVLALVKESYRLLLQVNDEEMVADRLNGRLFTIHDISIDLGMLEESKKAIIQFRCLPSSPHFCSDVCFFKGCMNSFKNAPFQRELAINLLPSTSKILRSMQIALRSAYPTWPWNAMNGKVSLFRIFIGQILTTHQSGDSFWC